MQACTSHCSAVTVQYQSPYFPCAPCHPRPSFPSNVYRPPSYAHPCLSHTTRHLTDAYLLAGWTRISLAVARACLVQGGNAGTTAEWRHVCMEAPSKARVLAPSVWSQRRGTLDACPFWPIHSLTGVSSTALLGEKGGLWIIDAGREPRMRNSRLHLPPPSCPTYIMSPQCTSWTSPGISTVKLRPGFIYFSLSSSPFSIAGLQRSFSLPRFLRSFALTIQATGLRLIPRTRGQVLSITGLAGRYPPHLDHTR